MVLIIVLYTQSVLTDLLLIHCNLSCCFPLNPLYSLSILFCFALTPQVYKIRGLAPISGSLALMVGSRKFRVPIEDWREKGGFLPIVWQWWCSSMDNSSHGVISFPYFGSTSGSGTTVPSFCPFRLWHSDNSSLLGVVHSALLAALIYPFP